MAKVKVTIKKTTSCPVTMDEFMKTKKMIKVETEDQMFLCVPRDFASGSFGYNVNGKLTIMIGDIPVPFQFTGNITAIGSKPPKK